MKRILCLLFAVLFLTLCGCGGKTGDARVTVGESSLYGREDLLDAVDAVMDDFQKGFEHCRMLRVEYSESHTLREIEYCRERGDNADVVVFLVDFHVGLKALAVGPMIPGQTCTKYQFILARDSRGEWAVRDKGYG